MIAELRRGTSAAISPPILARRAHATSWPFRSPRSAGDSRPACGIYRNAREIALTGDQPSRIRRMCTWHVNPIRGEWSRLGRPPGTSNPTHALEGRVFQRKRAAAAPPGRRRRGGGRSVSGDGLWDRSPGVVALRRQGAPARRLHASRRASQPRPSQLPPATDRAGLEPAGGDGRGPGEATTYRPWRKRSMSGVRLRLVRRGVPHPPSGGCRCVRGPIRDCE